MTIPAQAITEDPTLSAILHWRADSITLARLRPVLARLHDIPDQPCRFGPVPYLCAREYDNRLCITCAIRDIRAALFGEQPHEETDDRGTDRPDDAGGDDTDGPQPAAG